MREETHQVDFCVVGGGMAGMLAAIAAARHGVKVALVQDRPVLGGNASSEIRMHVCGAHGENKKETGLLEEIQLDNLYYNRQPCYSVWDTVLYGKTQYQDNLELFLNCSVNQCEMDGNHIKSVRGWQMTTETWQTIEATLFADCSGDGILAPLSGADYRIGREGRSEFDETIAPEQTDKKTMGMSCLLQAREYSEPQPFIAPDWAHKFRTKEDINNRHYTVGKTNYWWMEVGGEADSIHDTEKCREELLKIAYGVWDHIKNYADDRELAENWSLDWQGFLPGKRESRRYLGDHILTQNDIEAEGRFDDLVAYGGWTMDDHFPAGFYHPGKGTIFHPAPSPFGIPYRSLYSRNIDNLFCAGRCHSATHSAMSATRVMATTSLMGQAVGTAAGIAIKHGLSPRGVYEKHLSLLKNTLMDDDCYLPFNQRPIPELTIKASLSAVRGNPEVLRNGVDRPIDDVDNGWTGQLNDTVEYVLESQTPVSEVRIVFDSDLNRTGLNMPCYYTEKNPRRSVPATIVKAFSIDTKNTDGEWQETYSTDNNYQRLVKVPIGRTTKAIRLIPKETWASEMVHIFAFEVR